eukprot:CAMPEP_0197463576 /NCGR_PEP_ID=MMETSP1175-20131217/62181_1 /TAXON_ID=1003142 /ORGANISM="Triceratium dubium, Strain CCMP147" /LENGTH=108 /DNA_ID=CAMNT_0042999371 /DNA_START=60 /DNA_END=383 /DNA_ORIENTATION=-
MRRYPSTACKACSPKLINDDFISLLRPLCSPRSRPRATDFFLSFKRTKLTPSVASASSATTNMPRTNLGRVSSVHEGRKRMRQGASDGSENSVHWNPDMYIAIDMPLP